jgi:hypothetical protein
MLAERGMKRWRYRVRDELGSLYSELNPTAYCPFGNYRFCINIAQNTTDFVKFSFQGVLCGRIIAISGAVIKKDTNWHFDKFRVLFD